LPSMKHHSPWIKLTFINDFLLILKGGGGRIRETESDWLQDLGARPKGWAAAPSLDPNGLIFSVGC
jgi:hypothetical protein